MVIQIIAWMASGLYFSLIPITEIRGEHLTRPPDLPVKSQLSQMVSPAQLASLLNRHPGEDWALSSLGLINIDGQDRWRVFDFLWMLHIIDFDSRDDFNHPLLQIASALETSTLN